MTIGSIAVLGLGKVGQLAGLLLHDAGLSVTGYDLRPPQDETPFAVEQIDLGSVGNIADILRKFEGVLSCLPYHLNAEIATVAHGLGIHYFDLTEDVPTTKTIIELSKTAKGLMAPQCGLAPGFVGIVGASLITEFDVCRSLRMRVGALPNNPTGLLGYAFNWSPEGVVNEYLNDCEAIEEGQRKWVSPMEWLETVYVEGVKLEAFTTSGGLGTMCDTYLGVVDNIDYKSMRYPGHMQLMNFFFHELLMREQRENAGKILTHAKPPVDDDVVFIHVAAEGERGGQLARKEFVRSYKPVTIGNRCWTAIAWTTASSVAAVIELVSRGVLPARGFLKQEDVPLDAFLKTAPGSRFDLSR